MSAKLPLASARFTGLLGRSGAMALGALFASTAILADEGMWTYDHFPADKMRATYGWAPDAAWLRNAQLASIRLAQGCSASLVSPTGLVMTNHHCARACISQLANAKHDYIATGFYAAKLEDEKKCPALEANQLAEITDVTSQMNAATAGKSDRAFHEAERAAKAGIESACGTARDVRCEVVTLYHGGIYNLYRYKRYQDIRVVFAPEESVASFGGDPDNFNYPRFDLDAAFVRIYEHDKPLASANFLKFASRGVQAGDIAITSGNPGSTERESTVSQLQYLRDDQQPFLLNFLSELRGLLNQYATKGAEYDRTSRTLRASVENTLKLFKGMELALVLSSIMQNKAQDEDKFRARVAAEPALAELSGGAWDAIAKAMAHQRNIYTRYALLESFPRFLSPLLAHAIGLNRYAVELPKPDGERLEEYSSANFPALKQSVESAAPLYPRLEKAVLAWWLTKVREYLGTSDADVVALLGKRSPEEIAAALVADTKLADPKVRTQLLDGGSKAIDSFHDHLIDFARQLDGPARAVRSDYENNVKAVVTQNAALIAKARFALEGTDVYPDATFTMRLSYGTVSGYQNDGRVVEPTTNFAGAYAHATGRDPFKLPATWLKAETSVNAGTNLNFVSTYDVVGGNSGSPVIGRNGEIIGLHFDSTIQSLGKYFGFDPSVNRSIAVDVTGITEALRNIYHADRLVAELTPP
jgi:Peptidase S46